MTTAGVCSFVKLLGHGRSALGTLETSARTPYPTSERAEEKGNGGRPYGDQLGIFYFYFLPFAGIKKIQEVGVLRSCGVKLTQKPLRSLSCGEIASCGAASALHNWESVAGLTRRTD
jgi:hypothetical protein